MNEYSQCETMFLFKKGNSREKGLLFEFQRLWRYVSCECWRAGCTRGWGGGARTLRQRPNSVGALYCFLPESREKTLQSSRSASSCRCLGSCKTKRPSVTGDWEHSRTARGARVRSPGGPRGLSAHLPRRSAAHSRCVVSAE